MENAPQSRRNFLATLMLLLASGGLLVRYLTPHRLPAQRVLARAAATDVPAGGALVFSAERIALIRNDSGFYAISLVCTHLGCTVQVTEHDLLCPCHGSRFDRQGLVLKGPAGRPLERLKVEIHEGIVEIVTA